MCVAKSDNGYRATTFEETGSRTGFVMGSFTFIYLAVLDKIVLIRVNLPVCSVELLELVATQNYFKVSSYTKIVTRLAPWICNHVVKAKISYLLCKFQICPHTEIL